MNELVSVIIPVYNVEQYIDECINSVVGQSYNNLEIIIVDDGSTDSCGKRCDKWENSDSRIKVIHQQNQGLSGARNTAIDICKGEWITFIDSDDVVGKDYIKILLGLVKLYNVKISQCFSAELKYMGVEEENIEEGVLKSTQFLLSEKYQTMAWGKIYRRDIFTTARYPYGKIHEDIALTYRLVYEAENIAYTTQKLYFCHPARPDSINGSGRFYRKKLIILQFLKEQIAFYEEKREDELLKKGNRDYAYALLSNYWQTKKILKDRETALRIKKEYRKVYKRVVKEDENVSLKIKLLLMVCCILPGLWEKI